MTGNDIVAYSMLSHRAKDLDQKYLGKLFTSNEQTFILESPVPVIMVATFWAAKESAYKIYVKLTHHRYFRPLDFEVISIPDHLDPGNHARPFQLRISTPIEDHFVWVNYLPELVHAVIYPSLSSDSFTLITEVLSLPHPDQATNSHFLKATILQKIAKEKGITLTDLSIVKDEWGVPNIFFSDHSHPFDLSISHDGKWGGYITMIPR